MSSLLTEGAFNPKELIHGKEIPFPFFPGALKTQTAFPEKTHPIHGSLCFRELGYRRLHNGSGAEP